MTPFLAALIFESWAEAYNPNANPSTVQAYHNVIAEELPHLYAPMVPETFRGPKWGTR